MLFIFRFDSMLHSRYAWFAACILPSLVHMLRLEVGGGCNEILIGKGIIYTMTHTPMTKTKTTAPRHRYIDCCIVAYAIKCRPCSL